MLYLNYASLFGSLYAFCVNNVKLNANRINDGTNKTACDVEPDYDLGVIAEVRLSHLSASKVPNAKGSRMGVKLC